jgi:hypothetical protein
MIVATTMSQARPGTADPIRAVGVISTGSVEIHPEHALGTRKPLYWWLLPARRWRPRPINVYVIEHAKGLLLFDTGQDRASVTDDAYFPGGFPGIVDDRLARFSICEEETLEAQLCILGYSPQPTSAPRSSPTCTRTISAGSASCAARTCWSRLLPPRRRFGTSVGDRGQEQMWGCSPPRWIAAWRSVGRSGRWGRTSSGRRRR